GALVAVAEAVDRQIHADLADPAKRSKCQFVGTRHLDRSFGCDRAEMNITGRDRLQSSLRGPHQHTTLFIDRVENSLDDSMSGPDGDGLAEPGRAFQPEPADISKAPPLVPDAEIFHPGLGQRREQILSADLDA